MLERFKRHLERTLLVPLEARVLVGYSGGADSTCLLSLLKEAGYDVVAAHLNHGQRDEATEEMERCATFCKELGVPFISGNADVPKLAQNLKIGLEEAGRGARYEFFRQSALRTQCDLIATAHTRDDHIETVLFNLARGAGLAGIAGIPCRRDEVVRPLLIFSREETRAYCNERNYWTHNDPANADLTFSRARIRHRVLPELRIVSAGADEAIARLAGIAGDEDRFLNGMAAAALEQAEIHLNGELQFLTIDVEVAFEREKISRLPSVLFRRAMRLAAGALGGPLTLEHTERLESGIAAQPCGSVTADGGGVVIEWNAKLVHARQVALSAPFRQGLEVPGEVTNREFGWKFTVVEQRYDGARPVRATMCPAIDAAKAVGQLYFRTPKPGDTMRPYGFDGSRKLSDLLSEARLTKAARARLPVVCDMVGPIWAPAVCFDSRVAPNEQTNKVYLARLADARHLEGHNISNVESGDGVP